jgi:tripartite-type tricarboxylate transporter receptor subunit TctC
VLGLGLSAHYRLAAEFPTKTVRIVIPFSAGGVPDVSMRIVVPPSQ